MKTVKECNAVTTQAMVYPKQQMGSLSCNDTNTGGICKSLQDYRFSSRKWYYHLSQFLILCSTHVDNVCIHVQGCPTALALYRDDADLQPEQNPGYIHK